MVIHPKVRGFICTNAHPKGCAANVQQQIAYVKGEGQKQFGKIAQPPKNVLVIGASTGYGLASRISAAFGCGAKTIGVFFEKPAEEDRTGTAGWYNSAAFHAAAKAEGLYAKSINGDAFSDEIKQKTIDLIRKDLGQVDLVIYSIASPRRQHPKTGEVFTSTLKPIGKNVTQRGINTNKDTIQEVAIEAANDAEIAGTIAVMGGEDWQMWIDAMLQAGVLAQGCRTTTYTYIGDKPTWDIYWHGTIGAAKKDLDLKQKVIQKKLAAIGGRAYVSVLKAVVTQASSAIPAMPLYLALLFKIMKEKGTHEGCIEQVYGLYAQGLGVDKPEVDDTGRLRRDGEELKRDVQGKVAELWPQVTSENLFQISDYQGYKDEFLRLFGFGIAGVDYDEDVSPVVAMEVV
jgi:enoyl-[acyl-carrier protein] reductase/trans-2-enoyl-CoA reductase (NAD+)